jgi:pyridoxine 5-phosphate synthase
MNPLVTSGLDGRHDGTALSVNVNKVALLRNSRALDIPNLVRAATIALEAGADGITIHPRPDERHIRARDVSDLAELMKAWPQAEFNIEGNPFHNLMPFVEAVRPTQCTFVPDSAEQSTSDHGWRMPDDVARLRPVIDAAHAAGVRVSLYMDPDPAAMPAVRDSGADRVELYTETYARAHGQAGHADVLGAFVKAAEAAQRVGLGVNAGHDLNRANLTDFLTAVRGVQEVSIGHALIADALELGLADAVRAYLRCIRLAAVHRPSAHLSAG